MLVQVERGQRGLLYERLFDIAEALDVPPSALFDNLQHRPDPRPPASADTIV
jgi:hypothetical protein